MLPELKRGGARVESIAAQDAATRPRHRWYFFKEGFSPSIVSEALKDRSAADPCTVLDPFCGSGTVPLEAAIQGFSAVGVEVNPFLAFVCRAKLQQCKPTLVKTHLKSVLRGAKRGTISTLESFSTFCERKGRDKWLFNRPVLRSFEGAWRATPSARGAAGKLLRLALLGAAMDTCNAVRDGKCLRYKKTWEDDDFDAKDFTQALETRVLTICEDLQTTPLQNPGARILLNDVRGIDVLRPFQVCITSPPYLNSFDYTDVYRPELFLGRFVRTMRQLGALRQRTVRSHVQASWKLPTESDFGARYQEAVEGIRNRAGDLWDRRIPSMIQAYFEDMRTVLKALQRVAAPDAAAWIVVSDSAYAGVEIPVDLIVAEIAGTVGWVVQEVSVVRSLSRVAVQQWTELSERSETNSPHLRESLILLKAAPRPVRSTTATPLDAESLVSEPTRARPLG
jgi:DNA modification methylase